MKFNIQDLSSKLNKVDTELKKIDSLDSINTYGTFLDSKKEMIQLYVLFIFFGIHGDIISKMPTSEIMLEYDPD
jgi:hypothetical protein